MIKLHTTSKTISENGEITVNFTPISTDTTIVNGSLTLILTNDKFTVGKDYDSNLNEIV
jgi:hypothetical protein